MNGADPTHDFEPAASTSARRPQFERESSGKPDARLAAGNQALWESGFMQLQAFREAHGHCRVPKVWAPNPSLGGWVCTQRQVRRRGLMLAERQARLEQIGFLWEPNNQQAEERWEKRLAELEVFQAKHGHLNVTRGNETSPGLSKWCDAQREQMRDGRLSGEQKARLEALGFEWESAGKPYLRLTAGNQALWESGFMQLQAFRKAHGHCRVPKVWAPNPSLGGWVCTQRQVRRRGLMLAERQARLEQIGFLWEPNNQQAEERWEKRLAELEVFQAKHGHLNVTRGNETSPGLSKWCDAQREQMRDGRLSGELKARMEALGFEWESAGKPDLRLTAGNQALWESGFMQLQAFRKAHGHCRVPKVWAPNPSLGNWACTQRQVHRRGQMLAERQVRLDALGFDWWMPGPVRPQAAEDDLPKDSISQWEYFFARLAAFKEQHGHPHVPASWPEDRALSHWVREQRGGRIYGRLHFDQITRLEKLGFDW